MFLSLHHRRRHHRTRRQGAGTMLFMVFLVIFMLLLTLVVNYTYLAYSQLRSGEVTDTLARTAVTELLDESLLDTVLPSGDPSIGQADDVQQAESIVDTYLDKLNALADERQQLRYIPGQATFENTDIRVIPGRVNNTTLPVVDGNFTDVLGPGERYNTLATESKRLKNGSNRLYMFVRSTFTPEAATIGTISYATLDSRVLGFQPTGSMTTPVMPIGIVRNAWDDNRSGTFNGNNRQDFEGVLKPTSGNLGSSLVLLDFRDDEDNVVVDTAFAERIIGGLTLGDIDLQHDAGSGYSNDFLGPVLDTNSAPKPLEDITSEITVENDAEGDRLAAALNSISDTLVTTNEGARKIFPLVNTASNGTTDIVGFVGARVLSANYNATTNELVLRLEPEFVVHPTAVTAYEFIDQITQVVPENVYIHKLRLSR